MIPLETDKDALDYFLKRIKENHDKPTHKIREVMMEIYSRGYDEATEMMEDMEKKRIGNKVCQTLAEEMKVDYLAEIFDDFTEEQFRQKLG